MLSQLCWQAHTRRIASREILIMSRRSLTEGEMVNGQKHGYWVTYYANGFKRSEGGYVHGKKRDLGSITTKMGT